MKLIDPTRQHFGKLQVTALTKLGGRPTYVCQCDCGNPTSEPTFSTDPKD